MTRPPIPWLALFVAFAVPRAARAQQELPMITDRSYAIDLHQGAVLGTARIVGMGGASVAVAEGSAGILANPASVAVWPATSNDSWDWDFHLDYLNRLPGQDLDNNGIDDPDIDFDVNPFFTGGLIARYGVWAVGLTGSENNEATPADNAADGEIIAKTQVVRIAAGASLFEQTLAVGAALKIGTFTVLLGDDTTRTKLFDLFGGGIELGATWAPARRDFRLGAALSTRISGADRVELREDDCDPNDCQGYILPERVVAPWQVAVGGAYRWGAGTRWNQKIGARWRDERALIVAADAIVTGPSENGHGIGAFAQKRLQRSGEDMSFSARVGLEYEWLPGRLRVRTGSYWEPGRFEDVSGRLHGTLGVDVRVWRFCFWEGSYRVLLGIFGDGAKGYGNGGLTVGFWH